MAEKIEPRNINDKEVAIIQSVFTEETLQSMRALIFGLPVTAVEKTHIKGIFSDPLVGQLIKKRFYPELEKDTPIGQVQDIWLGVEQMINAQHPDAIKQAIGYKDLALGYTKHALQLLQNPEAVVPISMDYTPKSYPDDTLGIVLMARNMFIRHVEQQLLFLWLIVQQRTEKPEETAKKKVKNSSQ